MKNCDTCIHNGNQMIFPSSCTGCDDVKFLNYEVIVDNALKGINHEVIKDIATEFYYHWHNSAGTNTSQGFDDWWKINKLRFIFDKA